jgi:hypothetical protein
LFIFKICAIFSIRLRAEKSHNGSAAVLKTVARKGMQVRLLSSPPFSFLKFGHAAETNLFFRASIPAMRQFKSDKLNFPLAFIAVLFLALFADAQISVKPADETEVPVLKKIGSRGSGCGIGGNIIVTDEKKFKEISKDPDCLLAIMTGLDFSKQTLIGFRVGGDCFISASARVFRNENGKKYTVRVKNIWGGCRAGGSFQGWLVVDKIPADFAVAFTETRVDRIVYGAADEEIREAAEAPLSTRPNLLLKTRRIDLKGCIQTIFDKEFIIGDQATFLKTVRNDASREFCLKNLEKIDFDEHTLIGLELNTGYCETPVGLTSKAFRNDAEKRYIVKIGFLEPNEPCRARSQYDFWLLVPKLPAGYTVKFDIKGEVRLQTNR